MVHAPFPAGKRKMEACADFNNLIFKVVLRSIPPKQAAEKAIYVCHFERSEGSLFGLNS